jgi:tetratricopeptide (TPR) repeat protein
MLLRTAVAAGVLLGASAARAGAYQPLYAPPADWVEPLSPPDAPPPVPGAPLQILALDSQNFFGPDGDARYVEFITKALTPVGVQALGTLKQEWNPETDVLTIHKAQIIRGGKVIDLLADDKFLVLRREEKLEVAQLTGRLTAALQVRDLEVGDVLDVAATIVHRDPALQGRAEGVQFALSQLRAARYRLRDVWPRGKDMRFQASDVLGKPAVVDNGAGRRSITLDIAGVKLKPAPTGAPPRYEELPRLEVTEFAAWSDIATLMAPLFDKASTLAPDSPLKAEAAKIAARTSDPMERATLALELVQNDVRYLFVGLNDGGYVPASADDTWKRRFGDCKGKTAVLLALLKELGIEAQPALASTVFGDGMDQDLPMLGLFNHALVRARIGHETYWLDGTRQGDLDLRHPTGLDLHWVLPLGPGSKLERMDLRPPLLPTTETVARIGATAGPQSPVKVWIDRYERGDLGYLIAQRFGLQAPEQTEKQIKDFFKIDYDWVEPSTAGWDYDAKTGTLHEYMRGGGNPGWQANSKTGELQYVVDAMGFSSIGLPVRDKDEDQSAPWAVPFPRFDRTVTAISLPNSGVDWAFYAPFLREKVGGVAYRYGATIGGGAFVGLTSLRAETGEITADEKTKAGARLKELEKYSMTLDAPLPGGKGQPDSKDARVWAARGYDAMGASRPDEAMSDFERALSLDPTLFSAAAGRVAVFVSRKQYERALQEIDAAERHAAKPDAKFVFMRAEVLEAEGQVDKALELLTGEIAKHPDDAPAYEARARVYLDARKYDLASADAEKGLSLTPDSLNFLTLHGAAQSALKNYARALDDYERAADLEPDSASVFEGWGQILEKAGRPDDAARAYDEALHLAPASTATHGLADELKRKAGRWQDAIKDLDEAIEFQGDNAGMLNNRCWTRAEVGQELDKALADCDAALKLKPKSPDILDSRGLVKLRLGRFADAIADYDSALALSPKQASSLYGRGVAKLHKGDTAAGQADLAAAKALDPTIAETYTGYGVSP